MDYRPAQERREKKVQPGREKEEASTSLLYTATEILQSLPERFLREKAGDWETVFHFDISGPEGGQFTAIVKKGQCSVERGLNGTAKCTVKVSDQTYKDIELGRTKAEVAFMTGKIRISDLAEMMQFTKMFRRLSKM
ncbi:MAG: SCP2 sterol-binding domain-containing protein [Deltaproteobacteria bacterium]|nr:SCP2 sterol-binding domain-containing protein [Deltaproteobacteria bacterium]